MTYHGVFGSAARCRAAVVMAGKGDRGACPRPKAVEEAAEIGAEPAERPEAEEKRARRSNRLSVLVLRKPESADRRRKRRA